MSDQRRSFHLALPPHDPRSRQIARWLAEQPAGSDLSALLRAVIVAGLDHQVLEARLERQHAVLQQIADGVVELRRSGVAAPPAALPDPELDLAAEDLAALSDLFGSFDDV